ncbi:MAG: orotidine-5'-phosphate decarboxylase [Thermodesulfobacteriota bacterium]
MSLTPKDRLIFPLDFPSWKEASAYVRLLAGTVGVFKVGLELFIAEGPSILKKIKGETGAGIFLDLKLHDIPETVKRALSVISRYGVDFVTIYCDVGRRLAEAISMATGAGTKVLGVTLLTGIGIDDLAVQGLAGEFINDISRLVVQRAEVARGAGCSGVISSGQEVKAIREQLGRDFLIVTPGIRPAWSVISDDDQRRIVTPREAILNGADYIVVGRPIRTAQNPQEAARRIIEEIGQAS